MVSYKIVLLLLATITVAQRVICWELRYLFMSFLSDSISFYFVAFNNVVEQSVLFDSYIE